MAYPHSIRLNGPWQLTATVSTGGDPSGETTGKIDGPGGWRPPLGDDFRGTVRLVRRFGRPSNLEPAETVWLVLEQLPATCQLTLNGRPLATTDRPRPSQAWDITDRLAARNELCLQFVVADDPAGDPRPTPREVRLEVRGPG